MEKKQIIQFANKKYHTNLYLGKKKPKRRLPCQLHFCRGKTPPNECPGYDAKQSDGEVPVMLWLWKMWTTPSLPLLPGPLWPGVVAPDRALSMG